MMPREKMVLMLFTLTSSRWERKPKARNPVSPRNRVSASNCRARWVSFANAASGSASRRCRGDGSITDGENLATRCPNGHAVCNVETMEVTIMSTSTQSPSERVREIIRHLEEVEANLAQLARSLHQTRKHFEHALPELENWW